MISNFIDWMVDSLYEFKWFMEKVVAWEVSSLKATVQEIRRRLQKSDGGQQKKDIWRGRNR